MWLNIITAFQGNFRLVSIYFRTEIISMNKIFDFANWFIGERTCNMNWMKLRFWSRGTGKSKCVIVMLRMCWNPTTRQKSLWRCSTRMHGKKFMLFVPRTEWQMFCYSRSLLENWQPEYVYAYLYIYMKIKVNYRPNE